MIENELMKGSKPMTTIIFKTIISDQALWIQFHTISN